MLTNGCVIFLSTPSARRATYPAQICQPPKTNFYPRPPRGGRPVDLRKVLQVIAISIHALREEGDRLRARLERQHLPISIHALREEGDRRSGCTSRPTQNFYPRPPRGGRRACNVVQIQLDKISIHALREEGDLRQGCCLTHIPSDFYPRPPRGGRPAARSAAWSARPISIHALREEGDSKNRDKISIFL